MLQELCYECQSNKEVEYLNLNGQVLPWCWSCKTEQEWVAKGYIPDFKAILRPAPWETELLKSM